MGTSKRNEENNGIHITKIVNSVPCLRHGADLGNACWNLDSIHGLLRGICDRRARLSGCNSDLPKTPTHTKKDYK